MSQVDEFWYRRLSKSFVKEYWYNRRIFLEAAEYCLRPKFQPDFVIPPRRNDCRADTYRRRAIMDAVRMSNGKIDMLKAMSKERFLFELEIGQFSRCSRKQDPRNHCIPLLEVKDIDIQIIAMPRIIRMEQPSFNTVGEVVDCFRQLFEKIVGAELASVTAPINIVVDPTELLPHGFHPVITHYTPDMNEFVHAIRRTECWPRYCLIDFGISSI
ncbi:hypothetical protein DFH08DRAFT_779601 [Mycena albidolilacea]|uniref:Uncharacterized protein n=1 Tax=Mycena albidolilacea TaxID=1033008 RepID=A0AAD7A119_9AGAR|nr:hypothetical protein DFH08DRAFT_779601 [Mycena albidolilacea]